MMNAAALPANPFPGMNPYLESPSIWPGVHLLAIAELQGLLSRELPPDYMVTVDERVFVSTEPEPGYGGRDGIIAPDVTVSMAVREREAVGALPASEPQRGRGAIAIRLPIAGVVRERYLSVRTAGRREVVAVIELLSPANKRAGDQGRSAYLSKREEILHSSAHLVEIDLLRAGAPMPVIGDAPIGIYRIIVSDNRLWPDVDLYPFGIREPVPEFVLPLAAGSPGIAVNLNDVLANIYSARGYQRLVDYQQDPEPPLSDADRVWVDELLRRQGLRNGGI